MCHLSKVVKRHQERDEYGLPCEGVPLIHDQTSADQTGLEEEGSNHDTKGATKNAPEIHDGLDKF